MSRIRDIASILTSASVLSTDVETSAAITAAINALPPGYGRGNTASRPASPTVGDIYVNTQTGFVEIYESTGWSQVGGAASIVTGVTATNTPTSRAYNNGAASIAFTPGTMLGKTYTVTSSPGSYTASGSVSPITITGLQSSTQYTYTIVASNNYGTAAASSASSAVTATTVPQAPSITSVTGGNAQVSVAFSANATGGSAITGYTVTSSPGSLTETGSSSPLVVTGLTNGTAYTFTATATNANGTSAASSASSSVTPANLTFDVLVVASGGGGNTGPGAGGGAGGLLVFTDQTFSGTQSVEVAGGAATNTTGSDSRFGSLTLVKGGGRESGTGGSGGGGNYVVRNSQGLATQGQGNNGGLGGNYPRGYEIGAYPTGGGGGAGAAGGDAFNNDGGYSGNGGAGSSTYSSWGLATSTGHNVSGTVFYAGGGGGGGNSHANGGTQTRGTGGSGGGGAGGVGSGGQAGTGGLQNTGGGGGGGGYSWPPNQLGSGGTGGSGIVILRASGNYTASGTTGSPTRVVSGGYTYYTFLNTGSITF